MKPTHGVQPSGSAPGSEEGQPPAKPTSGFFTSVLSAELLEQRARALSQSVELESGPAHELAGVYHLFLRCGGETFAIPLTQSVEILANPEILPIPGTPPSIAGVVNVRGAIVDVIELRELLELGGASGGGGKHAVVLCESGQHQFGIAVEGVSGIEAILPASIGPVADSMPMALHEYVSGLARVANKLGSSGNRIGVTQQTIVPVLDAGRLFRSKQFDALRGEAPP